MLSIRLDPDIERLTLTKRKSMPTVASILIDLEKKGTEKTRKIYARHGMATENMFGVSVADLKVIAKKIKGQQALACELYATGNLDAMYLAEIEGLLKTVVKGIGSAQNRVRYTMNGFVIAVGTYMKPLLKQAMDAARQIGVVSVDVGDTACKVRLASEHIEKIAATGRVGQKRKTIRC
jgi:hypothetical protein